LDFPTVLSIPQKKEANHPNGIGTGSNTLAKLPQNQFQEQYHQSTIIHHQNGENLDDKMLGKFCFAILCASKIAITLYE